MFFGYPQCKCDRKMLIILATRIAGGVAQFFILSVSRVKGMIAQCYTVFGYPHYKCDGGALHCTGYSYCKRESGVT